MTVVKPLPRTARAYIVCAALGAGACALPALLPPSPTPWATAGLLAALYALCELPARCRLLGRGLGGSVPMGTGSFYPVLLAAALLLPPAAAPLTPPPSPPPARPPPAPARAAPRPPPRPAPPPD
ncbi:hypothetical protein ACFXHD_41230 [Streptomyces hydrogenans]|uniref:hypothetical protein n=1 Tax=Streptomyces hydrogenans TaxID=1873719 RepID=UPI00367BB467